MGLNLAQSIHLNPKTFFKILFKINHFLVKNRTFYNTPIKIEIFCNQNSIGLKYFADFWFGIFLVQIYRQKLNILRNKNSVMYSK